MFQTVFWTGHKACTVFCCSNMEITVWNPTHNMGMFLLVLPCIGRGLAMGQSPMQSALPNVYKQDPKIWQNMRPWTILVFHAIQDDLRILGFLNLISVLPNNESLNHALRSVHNLYISKRWECSIKTWNDNISALLYINLYCQHIYMSQSIKYFYI